jgi:hypothetical protein
MYRREVKASRRRGSSLPRLTTAWLVALSVVASVPCLADDPLRERTSVDGRELVLNGAGVNRRLFFKLYLVGLYLAERRQSPEDVLALGGPKRLSITLLRNLPTRGLVDALKGGIRVNCPAEERQALEGRIDPLAAALLAVEEGMRGDVITFDWLPGQGTLVSVNGEAKGRLIPGVDVYRALLRVWLGDHPVSSGLKKALRGRPN